MTNVPHECQHLDSYLRLRNAKVRETNVRPPDKIIYACLHLPTLIRWLHTNRISRKKDQNLREYATFANEIVCLPTYGQCTNEGTDKL